MGGVSGADGGRLGAGDAVEAPDAAATVVAGCSADWAESCSSLGFLRDAGCDEIEPFFSRDRRERGLESLSLSSFSLSFGLSVSFGLSFSFGFSLGFSLSLSFSFLGFFSFGLSFVLSSSFLRRRVDEALWLVVAEARRGFSLLCTSVSLSSCGGGRWAVASPVASLSAMEATGVAAPEERDSI